MQQALDDETLFKEWFGTMISEAKHDLDVNPVEPDYSADEVADLLSQGNPPSRCRGCAASGSAARAAPATSTAKPGPCQARIRPPSHSLCDKDIITQDALVELADQAGFLQLLTRLVNRGYWFFG